MTTKHTNTIKNTRRISLPLLRPYDMVSPDCYSTLRTSFAWPDCQTHRVNFGQTKENKQKWKKISIVAAWGQKHFPGGWPVTRWKRWRFPGKTFLQRATFLETKWKFGDPSEVVLLKDCLYKSLRKICTNSSIFCHIITVPSGFCLRERCESQISRVSARSEVLNPPMSSIPSGALLQFPVLPWCQGPERSLPARAAEVDTGNGWKWETEKTTSNELSLSLHTAGIGWGGWAWSLLPAKESVSKHWLSSAFDKECMTWYDYDHDWLYSSSNLVYRITCK